MRHIVRRGSVLMAAAVLGAAIAFPLGVLASHSFSDVPTSNPFHGDIDALADSGVTSGCGGGKFCPKDYVTREQMAAFLNRLGALAPNKPPVVNADKVDGKDEVLGAGNVVIRQGPWFLGPGAFFAIDYLDDATNITLGNAGGGYVAMFLQEPGTIDGQAYGFQSVQICWHDSSNVMVANTRVSQLGAPNLVEDGEDRPLIFPDCYTVTDETPSAAVGATRLWVQLNFSAAGIARVGNVTTTWVPIP